MFSTQQTEHESQIKLLLSVDSSHLRYSLQRKNKTRAYLLNPARIKTEILTASIQFNIILRMPKEIHMQAIKSLSVSSLMVSHLCWKR